MSRYQAGWLARSVGALLAACTLPGCMSSGGDGGSTLSNLFAYGGPTAPAVAAAPRIEVADCPPVGVTEGGAALRSGSGQITIANVARECSGRADGTVVVKVGVEGRALLGPGGTTGRFEAPVTIVVKRGDQVLASRTRRVSVAVPAGETSEAFVVVEDNLIVPPATGEFDIEVSLTSGPRSLMAARKRG